MQSIGNCLVYRPPEKLLLRHHSTSVMAPPSHQGFSRVEEPVEWGRKRISVKQVLRKNQRLAAERKNQLSWSQTTVRQRRNSPIQQLSGHQQNNNLPHWSRVAPTNETESTYAPMRKPSINTVSSYNWQAKAQRSFDTIAFTAENCSVRPPQTEPTVQGQTSINDSPQPTLRKSHTHKTIKSPSSQKGPSEASSQDRFEREPMFGSPSHPSTQNVGLLSFGKKQQKLFLSQLVGYFDAESKRGSLKSKSKSNNSHGLSNNSNHNTPEQMNISDEIIEEFCEDSSRVFGFNTTHNLSSLVRHVEVDEQDSAPSGSDQSLVIDNHRSMMHKIHERTQDIGARFEHPFL